MRGPVDPPASNAAAPPPTLVSGAVVQAAPVKSAQVLELRADFLNRTGEPIVHRRIELRAADLAGRLEWLGWVESPPNAARVRIDRPERASNPASGHAEKQAAAWPVCDQALTLHVVPERDPKCHPLANVPRWSLYQPALTLTRVLIPESLAPLTDIVRAERPLEILRMPKSLAALAAQARNAIVIADPTWLTAWRCDAEQLARAAEGGWLIVDLESFAFALQRGGKVAADAVTYESKHGLFSARVEYADVPTRGFALQDVLPFTTLTPDGQFSQRSLTANRAWKSYAEETGFATLLASETPWERRHADVLSAARPCGRGELIVTDLPWLAAGALGPLLAPTVAEQLLRMHVAEAAPDELQFWMRWNDGQTLTRDIADFARRYAPLTPIRWQDSLEGERHARLGVRLHGPNPANGGPRRHLLIRSGSIDESAVPAAVPPEPLILLMKWLAREVREDTAWARRVLTGACVTWQFETARGLKFAVQYESAGSHAAPPVTRAVRLWPSSAPPAEAPQARTTTAAAGAVIEDVTLPDEGFFGDRSHAVLRELTELVTQRLS